MKKHSKLLAVLVSVLVFTLLAFPSCKSDDEAPPNPYDNVDYGGGTDPTDPGDPCSIVTIHKEILQNKCNNPGCHDGSFEPDFRTVQSAWSTLVYHSVFKNTADTAFQYRVIPHDTANSLFWYRVTRGDAQLQQMPATGDYLTADEFDRVQCWINNGALDMFGNAPTLPNGEPTIITYLALNSLFVRIDTNRVDGVDYLPFLAPANETISIVMIVEDDSTEVADLEVNQLKLSYDMDDFSNATTINATAFPVGNDIVWLASVNTGNYPTDTTLYMRYYVNDGDHTNDTEFPRDDLHPYYKSYFAFYIEP